MKKVDATVINETKYIAAWVVILSVLLQSVFILIGKWDYTVILGNLLSGVAAVLNFFLMGITIQQALGKDGNDSGAAIKMSQLYRFLVVLIVVVIGVALPCFHTWAVIIPVFFPRIAIAFRPLFDKKKS